jgi:hypothetical protein
MGPLLVGTRAAARDSPCFFDRRRSGKGDVRVLIGTVQRSVKEHPVPRYTTAVGGRQDEEPSRPMSGICKDLLRASQYQMTSIWIDIRWRRL